MPDITHHTSHHITSHHITRPDTLASALALGALTAIGTPHAQAQTFGGFAPQQLITSLGFGPISIAQGDFNGDGALDLAVGNHHSDDVSILLGDGAGGFAPQLLVSITASLNSLLSVASGDLNGDGRLDLAVSFFGDSHSTSTTLAVLLGNGNGTFIISPAINIVGRQRFVAMGDLDGDGALDLAVAVNTINMRHPINAVFTFLGNGAGGFVPQQTPAVGMDPDAVALGDLDGDGSLDLAVTNQNGNNVSILLGDGLGNYSSQVTFPAGAFPRSIAMGDLNGDGALDLSVANFFDNNVSILIGDGAGSFAPQQTFSAGIMPTSVAMGDLNGDGALDLAVADAGASPSFAGTVSILLGDGMGSFAPQQTFPAGDFPESIAMSDLNGDGAPDLAVANGGSDNFSIFINQTAFPSPCPADLNGDGVVNGADLATLLTQWGTNAPADLNSDGVVNGADLATLLTNWGACL